MKIKNNMDGKVYECYKANTEDDSTIRLAHNFGKKSAKFLNLTPEAITRFMLCGTLVLC